MRTLCDHRLGREGIKGERGDHGLPGRPGPMGETADAEKGDRGPDGTLLKKDSVRMDVHSRFQCRITWFTRFTWSCW